MASTNYTTLVAWLRTAGNDTATSNPKMGETPQGLRGNSQALFRLAYPNPVAATIFMTYGSGIIRQAAGLGTFALTDPTSGYVTLLGAGIPDSGLTQPFYFDYFYQWFTDADYNTMLDSATTELGGTVGVDLPQGLYSAQVQYALAHYWNRRASQYANLFSSKTGMAEADPHTPTLNFAALAKAARAYGRSLRDDYYTGDGAKLSPASGTITYGMDPITPRY